MVRKNVLIMGAAGRDFHVFNTLFRNNPDYNVVCFTATQIPDIEGRKYPPSLAGDGYPDGIPIYAESELTTLIVEKNIDLVYFSYSDIPYDEVMSISSIVTRMGADFALAGARTMIPSSKPVISICATRTGCGKSQTTRRIIEILGRLGKRTVVIRHPMPYGDLAAQAVQRFATYEDLDRHKCTIEEREEYEPHIDNGAIVYAGVDYEAILREAEKEADVILWDGGNNDFSFYRSDLYITVTDPHRIGDEISYYPSEVNLRLADVVIINKIDTADIEDIRRLRRNIRMINPVCEIIEAASPISVAEPSMIKGKRTLVIEDGPTVTHGEMPYGAGFIAADRFEAGEIIEPKAFAVGSIAGTYDKYPHLEYILPAMGYSDKQVKELEETIRNIDCDVIVTGTPIDITRIITVDVPIVRALYDLQEIGKPDLDDVIARFIG